MTSIGVIGGKNTGQTMDILNGIFAVWNNNNITLIRSEKEENLITVAGDKSSEPGKNFYLYNSDRNSLSDFSPEKPCTIITFGLNPKACVTLSSVNENTLVCCIQRPLPTLEGSIVIQQEFSVSVNKAYSPCDVLGAVTTALVCNFPAELFSGAVI